MRADLRTIVLRLLHAALAWLLPHARALYTRLENLTRQAASTSGRDDRDARAELDLALRTVIDRAEARLAHRVGTIVAFVQSLLARLALTTRDGVSRAEAVIRELLSDRAALLQAAKAARLAQARAEITGRAALGRARKLSRRLPAARVAALCRHALVLAAARLRAALGSPAARRAGLGWLASNFSASRRAAALRLLANCRAAFASRLSATRRGGAAGFLAKARSVQTRAFALALRAAATVRTASPSSLQRAGAESEAAPPVADTARPVAESEAARGEAPLSAVAGWLAAEGVAAQLAVEAARREARPGAVADGEVAQSAVEAARIQAPLSAVAGWLAAEGVAAQSAVEAARREARLGASADGQAAADGAAAFEEDVAPRVTAAARVAEDGQLVGLAALMTDVPAQRRRGRVPDGVRVAVAAVMVLAVTAGIGLWSSGLGDDAEKTVKAQPSSAAPEPTPTPTMAEAAGPIEAVPQIVPLSQRRPITGPNRPPLPDDEAGPYGSRRTTGTYEVALTFDDGPDPRYTPEVLALLRQYRVKATFCVIGVNVIEFPHLVRAIAAEGHTLCNHSWVHDTGLGVRSYSTIASDLTRTNEAIRAAAPGSRVSYFRHPGGAWTQAAVNSARQQGMTSLHWDVDPRDWLRPGPRAISNTVTGSTQPGSIVLLHDGGGDRLGTVEALRSILPNLASRLRLVALPPGIDPPRLHGIHLPIHAGQQ